MTLLGNGDLQKIGFEHNNKLGHPYPTNKKNMPTIFTLQFFACFVVELM
jgi:hypothetical protein